jgi:hypothetical protein
MKRINLFRKSEVRNLTFPGTAFPGNPATLESVTWGKINFEKTTGTLVFAALLIVCSIAVGCSSDKPQPASSNNSPAISQPTPPAVTMPPAPVQQAAAKPVHKKVVRKAPVMLAYTDKTSGVSFQYPKKYSLKTGDSAEQLVSSAPVPMDFVQPGGVAVAAVAVPETAYPKSDLGPAFFDVSVNKALTAEQCGQFLETKAASPAETGVPTETTAPATPAVVPPAKLMIGDMELQSAETLATQGTREEASKYYHVFENGACYEFALKVSTTNIDNQGGAMHVDRGEVFKRLEKILATVKIAALAEVTASAPVAATTTAAPASPAQ